MPSPDRSPGTPLLGPPTAARDQPGGAKRNELDEELALTLAGLLAEYGAPDPSPTPPQDDVRPPDVAVPAARRHVSGSGSMPLPPTDQRFAARPAEPPDQVAPPSGEGAFGGRAPRGENGARLANLLAEAMDAFRHTGPEESGWGPADPVRGNGGARSDSSRDHGDPVRRDDVPARAHDARTHGRTGNDPGRRRPDCSRGPEIGTRRG